jgi:sRNA-binding protein
MLRRSSAYGNRDLDIDMDRLVVNMLRHEFTSYGQTRSTFAHVKACEAIAKRFPWLQDECERQMQQRAKRDHQRELVLRIPDNPNGTWASRRKDRADRSREAIEKLSVGEAVTVTVGGYQRSARITGVGRSRVTVEFTTKSGASRTAVVYASSVRPGWFYHG